jgi:hypothetical protein
MEFYSATNKNEILSLVAKWMELKGIVMNEISQTQKNKFITIVWTMSHSEVKQSGWEYRREFLEMGKSGGVEKGRLDLTTVSCMHVLKYYTEHYTYNWTMLIKN